MSSPKANAEGIEHSASPAHRIATFVSAVTLTTMLFTTNGFAQDPPPLPGNKSPTKIESRRVYIPIEDLNVVLDRDKRGVLMPVKEFLELYGQAKQNEEDSLKPPAAIVVSNANYTASISGEQLLITARIQFTQFEPGWSIVPLPFQQLAVEKATVNGNPARLGRLRQGKAYTLQLLNDQVGTATLDLELSTPLTAVGSDKVASFGLIDCPSATLGVTVPAGKRLLVHGLSVNRPSEIDQPATYHVAVGGRRDINLRITERDTERSTDSLLFATTGYRIDVAPGEVSWLAITALQVYGVALDRMVFTVPKTLEIADVQSTGLESWKLDDSESDPNRTQITLNYRQPFNGGRQVTFRGVTTTVEDEPWKVPELLLEDVTSHIGKMAVRAPAGVRLRTTEATGVRRTVQPPNSKSFGPATFFEVWREDFSLSFLTQTKQRELQTAISTIVDISDRGLELQTLATVESSFASLFELDVTLPAEWTVTAVQVGGKSADWQTLPQQAGLHAVRIPLNPPLPKDTETQIIVQAQQHVEGWPVQDDPFDLILPEVRLPQSAVVEGTYLIKAEEDLDVVPVSLSGLDPVRLNIEGERLGFTYQDSRFTGQLKVTRKPTRILASTLSISRLEKTTLHTHLESQLIVEGGGIRTLHVALSESAGEDVRFLLYGSQSRIVEQSAADPADGERVWTLQFDRRIKGSFAVAVDVRSARGEAEEFSPHRLRVVDAERENGYVAIEAAADQRLKVTATDADDLDLPDVDPADLPQPRYAPKERVVAAYRYLRPGYSVTLSADRFDRLAVPTAVCYSAELKSVIGENGQRQHQAEFSLVAVGVQSLRVVLAEDSELWATLVDGQPVEVRSLDGAYLVPLIQTAQPDARRTLQLFYKSSTEPLGSFGRLKQQPPRLTVMNGQGEEQPLELLAQNWTVHYPADTLLTTSDGDFHPDTRLDRTSFLGAAQQSFSAPSPDQLLSSSIQITIVIAIIGILTMGYRKMRFVGFAAAAGVLFLIGFMLTLATQFGGRTDFTSGEEDDMEAAAAMDPTGEMMDGAVGFQIDSNAASLDSAMDTVVGAMDRDLESMDDKKMEGRELVSEITIPSFLAPSDAPVSTPPTPVKKPPTQASQPVPDDPAAPKSEATRTRQPRGPASKDDSPRESVTRGGTLVGLDAPATVAQGGPSVDTFTGPAVDLPFVTRGSRRTGGRLSLSLRLLVPKNSVRREFSYLGTETTESGVGLDVVYESLVGGTAWRLAVMTGVALIFWWFRRSSVGRRGLMAAMGITVPLALVTLTPVSWHVFLDGIFLGSAAGIVLWLLCAVGNQNSPVGAWLARNGIAKAATVLAAALITASGTAAADEKAKTPPKKPQPPAVTQQQPTIVVPYDAKQNPLSAERVFLPHDQFIKLWNQAHPDRRVQPPAPVDGLVAEAFYSAELTTNEAAAANKASVAVTARIVLFSFRDRQITLPVPLGAVALNSAQLNGAAAPIVTRAAKGGGTQLDVVIAQSGVHVLDLQFQVPAEITGPAGQFQLPTQSVPAGRLFFTLPAQDLTVRVNGSSSAFRLQSDDQRDVVQIPINGGNVLVAWQPKQADGAVDGIVHVESGTAVIVDDSGVRISTGFHFDVPQGSLADVSFSLPENVRVQEIAGPDVAGWEMNDNPGQRSIRIFFRRKVDDSTSVRFELFIENSRIGNQAVDVTVPNFRPTQVTRETGAVAIFAGDPFGLRAGSLDGIVQTDVAQFRSKVELKVPKQPERLAYRFTSRPFQLPLTIERRQPQSVAEIQYGVNVGRRKVTYASHLKISLAQAPRSSLSFRIPTDFIPIEVDATNMADWFVTPADDAAGRVLTIEFTTPQFGNIEATLRGSVVKQPNDAAIALTAPLPLEISRLTSHLAVWLDSAFAANLTSFDGWRSVDPGSLVQQLRNLRPNPVQFAFTSNQTELQPVVLSLTKATPQLSAACVSIVTVTDTFVDYSLALQWNITRAAADTFQFVTPKWLAGRLDFKDPNIRQVTQTEVGTDRTAWTIHLQEPTRQRYFVLAQATLPPVTADVRPPTVEFATLPAGNAANPTALETQQQYVLLINLSQAQLSPDDPNAIESVQRTELPIKVSDALIDQAAEIVKLKRGGAIPVWKVSRFEQQQGAAASVNVADLVMVIANDATWRMQATYTIRNRSRQFLALRLPEKSSLLSVFVNNRPSRPVETKRKGQQMHLIALPKTSEADLSFPVKIVLSGRLKVNGNRMPSGLHVFAKEIELPAPHVVSQTDDPEFGIPVAKTVWTVYLPKDLDASPVDDADKNNLTAVDYDESGLAYELNRLNNDAAQLFNVWKFSPSAARKMKAADNLKQIGTAIQNYEERYGFYGNEDENMNSNLDLARRTFQRQYAENSGWFEQQKAIDGASNFYFLDEQSQRQQVSSNNYDVISRNGWGLVGRDDDESKLQSGEKFRFDVADKLATPDSTKDSKSKKAPANAKKRSVRREQSLSNLSNLNKAVESAKQAQQAEQEAKEMLQQAQQMDRLQQRAPQTPAPSNEGGRSAARNRDFRSVKGIIPLGEYAQEEMTANLSGAITQFRSDQGGEGLRYVANTGYWETGDADGLYAAGWTRVGGLSLAIDIPQSGQKLTFSKVSGAPKLTLSIRPRRSLEVGFGVVWSLVWLVIGLGIAIAVGRAGSVAAILHHLPKAMMALGLLVFFLVPHEIKWLGFTVFVVGAIAFGFQHRRPAAAE